MSGEKRLAIFCSSSSEINPNYNQAARELTRAACSLGYVIVSGGTVKGTMGVVADEVVECGGKHVGVIPRFMTEVAYPKLSEVVWTDTMSERKEEMRRGTCAAVALPGGIGTLDELIETLTLAKLKRYSGKVFALSVDGFYDPLAGLLDYFVSTGMLDEHSRSLIEFPSTVTELTESLSKI